MHDPVALRVQGLHQAQQVLVLSRLLDGRFDAPAIRRLYEDLALPAPANMHQVFAAMRDRDEIVQVDGEWRLTPLGRKRSNELADGFDLKELQLEANKTDIQVLTEPGGSLIPPYLAPPSLLEPLRDHLDRHPFELSVFGMTRFPDEADAAEDPDPVSAALEAAHTACDAHGLHFGLASDGAIHDDLWHNVTGYMFASRYGIAFFEDRRGKGLNYNLTIEVGAMLMSGRRCLLMKDESIKTMPTDLVGQIYRSVDIDDADAVSEAVHSWIADDLHLGECNACPDD